MSTNYRPDDWEEQVATAMAGCKGYTERGYIEVGADLMYNAMMKRRDELLLTEEEIYEITHGEARHSLMPFFVDVAKAQLQKAIPIIEAEARKEERERFVKELAERNLVECYPNGQCYICQNEPKWQAYIKALKGEGSDR